MCGNWKVTAYNCVHVKTDTNGIGGRVTTNGHGIIIYTLDTS